MKMIRNKTIIIYICMIICISMLLLLICGYMVYYCLTRYFFYNKHNVYAQRAIIKSLEYKYDGTFNLLSTEFETREEKIGGAKYVHIWTFTFEDDTGKEFSAYLWGYGLVKNGDGNSHAADYSAYYTDTYGQLCIEERLGDKFDLQKYRCVKNSQQLKKEDYVFVCSEHNEEEIANILTQMYFEEIKAHTSGGLLCLVYDNKDNAIFRYTHKNITLEMQDSGEEITEETVYAYILNNIL